MIISTQELISTKIKLNYIENIHNETGKNSKKFRKLRCRILKLNADENVLLNPSLPNFLQQTNT